MMNSVLEVLIHFFKRSKRDPAKPLDGKQLLKELNQVGLSLPDIENTVSKLSVWLDSQTSAEFHYPIQHHAGTRLFTTQECLRLNKKCRTFLLQLEQNGVLNPVMRERIIDQLMQIDRHELVLPRVQWIVFQMLLHEAPPQHVAYLERQFFNDILTLH